MFRFHFITGFDINPHYHALFLREQLADPCSCHKGRIVLESFLRNMHTKIHEHLTKNFSDYWRIVALHLSDDRVHAFLRNNNAHAARIANMLQGTYSAALHSDPNNKDIFDQNPDVDRIEEQLQKLGFSLR